MSLRSDFTRIEVVRTQALEWQQSPSPTVWRKRLEHSGPVEAGRVTSVVRYDAQSRFKPHPHPRGEEILVLEGVFSDEHGDYPAGSYLLNPEGFKHAPFSREGCVILVKLRQYAGEGRKKVALDTGSETWSATAHNGARRLPLHVDPRFPDRMELLRLDADVRLDEQHYPGGAEMFIVEGDLLDEHGSYGKGDWVRYPPGTVHTARSRGGALVYLKTGHLSGLL